MRSPVFLLIGTTIALTGCRDLPLPSAPEEADGGSAAFAIVDGATADTESAPLATQNTFFLPPLVDDPVSSGDATGVFDPTHRPIFRIVELPDGEFSCGIDDGSGLENRTVAVFTMDDGPGSETIRVVPEDEHYVANWHTKSEEFGVDPDCIYQIQVETAGLTAATADVQVAANGSGLKNIETDEYVALKDGSTLVIKVRIQEFCAPGEICSAGFIDPATGGTVSLFDPATGNLVAELQCGVDCADGPFVLSLTLFPNDADPSPDLGNNQFPYFVNAETFPPVTFTEAVFTVCQTVAFQEGRTISDGSLRLFRVDDGVTQIRDDPSFASQCAAADQMALAPAADGGLFAKAPARTLGRAVERLAGLFTPQPLGAAMFLHGGLNTVLRNEEFSDWGATDVAQIEATVLGDGVENVTVSVAAPSEDEDSDFDTTGDTGPERTVLFEDLPIFEDDPLVDAPAPAYTVSVDEATLPAGITCASSSQDVLLDVAGETETVTFVCTGLGSIAGVVQDAGEAPIPGAQVVLSGTNFGATTDLNGQFLLSNIPAGSYTLQTSIAGSTCPDQPVVVEAGGQVNVTVTCTAEVVEGIVIDGVLSEGEWDGADVFEPFTVDLPGGSTTTATIFMTNTDTEILMAIEFAEDLSGHELMTVGVRMDEDDNGSWDDGEDGFVAQQRNLAGQQDQFVDDFFSTSVDPPQGQRDDLNDGTNDGRTVSTDGNTTVVEVAKGVNTGDVLDADLQPGQLLPFFLSTNIGPSTTLLVRTVFPAEGWASYTVR